LEEGGQVNVIRSEDLHIPKSSKESQEVLGERTKDTKKLDSKIA